MSDETPLTLGVLRRRLDVLCGMQDSLDAEIAEGGAEDGELPATESADAAERARVLRAKIDALKQETLRLYSQEAETLHTKVQQRLVERGIYAPAEKERNCSDGSARGYRPPYGSIWADFLRPNREDLPLSTRPRPAVCEVVSPPLTCRALTLTHSTP